MYDAARTNEEIAGLFEKKTLSNPWYIFDNTTHDDDDQDRGSNGKKIFFFILKWFGNCFVNHKEYNILVQANSLFSDVATISDEAFGYFTLERCWDSWKLFKETDGEEKIENEHSIRKSNTKFGGWKKSGAVRFSEIAHLVKISRDTDLRKKIEQDYKKYVWEENNQNKVSKPSKKSDVLPRDFVAYNDLSEDDEDDQASRNNFDTNSTNFVNSEASSSTQENDDEAFESEYAMEIQTFTNSQQTSKDQNKSYCEGEIIMKP